MLLRLQASFMQIQNFPDCVSVETETLMICNTIRSQTTCPGTKLVNYRHEEIIQRFICAYSPNSFHIAH